MDFRLHFELTQFILGLYYRQENSLGGQLIGVSQMTYLLSTGLLKKDQFLLVSRESRGSKLKKVQDLGVRNEASF